APAVQERAEVFYLLMTDQRYGVIRNIQDAHYGGRRCYTELHTPDYAQLSASLGLAHTRIRDLREVPGALGRALSASGPFLLEIDMLAVGDFKTAFAGPPSKPA